MKKNFKKASEVKKVAAHAKKNAQINEAQVKEFVNNCKFEQILLSIAQEKWDQQPLQEDKVHHLQNLGGIRIYWIKDNRRSFKRALKMLDACEDCGMTTPAIMVDAKVVNDWGLTMIDPATCEDVMAEEFEGAYCVMEGHGRFHAFLLSLALAAQSGKNPFDYKFVYNYYSTPEEFGKAYVSTNLAMTRTTNKDRLGIAGARSKNPLVISYLSKIKDDKVIAKAAYFLTFGRELSPKEVAKLTYGEDDAPQFDKDLIDGLALCYESFKKQFGNDGGAKIYRGVPAAQWCADQLNKAEDKAAVAMVISDKVNNMSKDIYTAILTASTNKREHVTRDQVIKKNLDLMMQSE